MNDKKLTDSEIKKALECCGRESCFGCPYHGKCHQGNPMITDALDLITRQQAKIDNLKVENQSLRSAANSLKMHYEEAQAEIERLNKVYQSNQQLINALNKSYFLAKTEAYKEFAERLKYFIIPQKADGYTREIILKRDIDNLVKEMVGENIG